MAPTITMRLTNPIQVGNKYTVYAEFKADQPKVQLSGMNVRFFFDSNDFKKEFKFTNFTTGYGVYSPYPNYINTATTEAAKGLFNFKSFPTYVNSSISLLDKTKKVYLDDWTTLFSIELTTNTPNPVINPAIVLDLEQDTSRGSFLAGSDGIVISALVNDSVISSSVLEKVIQFNWTYNGSLFPPYGSPTN